MVRFEPLAASAPELIRVLAQLNGGAEHRAVALCAPESSRLIRYCVQTLPPVSDSRPPSEREHSVLGPTLARSSCHRRRRPGSRKIASPHTTRAPPRLEAGVPSFCADGGGARSPRCPAGGCGRRRRCSQSVDQLVELRGPRRFTQFDGVASREQFEVFREFVRRRDPRALNEDREPRGCFARAPRRSRVEPNPADRPAVVVDALAASRRPNSARSRLRRRRSRRSSRRSSRRNPHRARCCLCPCTRCRSRTDPRGGRRFVLHGPVRRSGDS